MNISEIRTMPTVVEVINPTSKGTHESCLRAYQILEKVKMMLKRKDSTETILEVIEECESYKPIKL